MLILHVYRIYTEQEKIILQAWHIQPLCAFSHAKTIEARICLR